MATPKQNADNIRKQQIEIERELTAEKITLGTAFGRATGLLTIAAMQLECTDPMTMLDPIVEAMEATDKEHKPKGLEPGVNWREEFLQK